jgi:hypothetical protein
MTNKFLKTSKGLELSKLQNGTADLNLKSLLIGGSAVGGVSEQRVVDLESKTANQTSNSYDTTFTGKVSSEALQISDALYDSSMSSSITMTGSEIKINADTVSINGNTIDGGGSGMITLDGGSSNGIIIKDELEPTNLNLAAYINNNQYAGLSIVKADGTGFGGPALSLGVDGTCAFAGGGDFKSDGNIIPNYNDRNSLGTVTNRWNEIHVKTGYFAKSTIHLGENWRLHVNESSELTVSHDDTTHILAHPIDGISGGSVSGGLEVGSKANLLAKTGMSEGQQFYMNANLGTSFTSQENKLWTYTGRTWQVVGETIEMLASTDFIEGNTVEVSADNDYEVMKTNTGGDVHVIGVIALQGCTAGDWVTVATRGIWGVASENDTYSRTQYLTTDATDGLATRTTSESGQPFAKVLENRTTILAGTLIFALIHCCEIY